MSDNNDWLDDAIEYCMATPLRRTLVALTAPVWLAVFIPVGLVGLFFYFFGGMLWSPVVMLVSWIIYRDHYVLGKWWWNPFEFSHDNHDMHHEMTVDARKKLRLDRQKDIKPTEF